MKNPDHQLRLLSNFDRRILAAWLLLALLAVSDFYLRVLNWSEGGGRQSFELPEFTNATILRPPANWVLERPNQDSLNDSKTENTSEVQVIDESAQTGELPSLVVDGSSYILQACFLFKGEQKAVLKDLENTGDGNTHLLTVGGNFGPYTVTVIEESSVTLDAGNGRKVTLSLFLRTPQETRSEKQ